MAKRFSLCLLICCLFARCHTEENKQKEATAIFSNYLQKHHHLALPASLHYYVVIPSSGCPYCVNRLIEEIEKNDIPDNVTVILSWSGALNREIESLSAKKNVLLEKKGEITRYDLGISTTTLITASPQSNITITSIIPASADEIAQHEIKDAIGIDSAVAKIFNQPVRD